MTIFHSIINYDDFDHYNEATTWDLELEQLSPGKFHVDMTLFGDDDIQIGQTMYSQKLLQHGSAPDGLTFVIHHPRSAPIVWRYLEFPPNGLIVFPDDNEHQGVSYPCHHPLTMTFSESFFITTAMELGFPDPHKLIRKGEVLLCHPESIYRLQTFVGGLCEIVRCTKGKLTSSLVNPEMKWRLTRFLLIALASSQQAKPNKRQLNRRKQVVDRVLEYVDADPFAQIKIKDLCRVVGVDERTLRNIFYESFSLSPKKYLKYHRLNDVRSALKRIDDPNILIADIANENGFWHMGQFASDYRQLFGELPSETLIKKKQIIA